jgi:hypothetical protein
MPKSNQTTNPTPPAAPQGTKPLFSTMQVSSMQEKSVDRQTSCQESQREKEKESYITEVQAPDLTRSSNLVALAMLSSLGDEDE